MAGGVGVAPEELPFVLGEPDDDVEAVEAASLGSQVADGDLGDPVAVDDPAERPPGGVGVGGEVTGEQVLHREEPVGAAGQEHGGIVCS